jgi:hypothetical protein
MGGGGAYFDRDVTKKSLRTEKGFSEVAQEKMTRIKADPAVLPRNRKLVCKNKSPVVFGVDDTGSMGILPKIFWDKAPMFAGQIVEQGYIEDPSISISAIGDITSDIEPIQISDFTLIRNLDDWLQRIWLEGNGGAPYRESYEFLAYFYARYCEIPDAETPFFFFLQDEGFREELRASDLQRHFGGEHQSTDSQTVFNELIRKFKGNVFVIHRHYASDYNENRDNEIVKQWEDAFGKERIIKLGSDLAITDTILGVIALVTGSRTLDEYIQDMIERGQDKTPGRIEEVRKSLEPLAASLKVTPKPKVQKTKTPEKPTEEEKPETESPIDKKKPGRLF